MNRSAVFLWFSSRCTLGDILPLFLRMDRRTFVSPTVCSRSSTSWDAQPNFWLLRTRAIVALSVFTCFCLFVRRFAVFWVTKSTFVAKFAAWIRLVFDTFGRMRTIARRLRALSFQVAATRKLLLFTRRIGTLWDSLLILSHLFCLFSVIEVQATENSVDNFTLVLCFSCSCHVYCMSLLWNTVFFLQVVSTIPLFSVFAFTSVISLSSDTRSPVISGIEDSILRLLVQVLLDHVLKAGIAC